MGVWHGRSRRKPTGGLNRSLRARMKRKYEMGRPFEPSIVDPSKGEEKRKVVEGRSNKIKVRIKNVIYANVTDPSSGTTKKVKVLEVVENKSNRHFARTGTVTKGAVIKTEIGIAKVTSRPNQHGVVNAVLVEG